MFMQMIIIVITIITIIDDSVMCHVSYFNSIQR